MLASRFPRFRRAVLPLIAFTSLNVSVHPAQAAPPVLETTLPVAALHDGRIPLPLRTNLVAFSIRKGSPVPEVEVRHEDGTWLPLHVDPDHGPDPIEGVADGGRLFSEPVWLGTVDNLEVRTDRRVPVRLHLINSAGDASRAPSPVRWLGSAWRALTVPRSAEAAVPDQNIITRKQWGADESWVTGGPGPARRLEAFFVHHTDNSNRYSRSSVPALLRGIYRYHTKTQGWSDIGYNFLIDRFGRIYEGRRGSISEPIIGAHARGANEGSAGVSLIGNFTSVSPSRPMRTALARLIAWKADVHHVPVVGTTKLGGRSYKRISGHRDANSTACPGNQAYSMLRWLRRASLNYGMPKLYQPRTSGSVVRPDGDGVADRWRVTAWASHSLTWSLRVSDAAGAVVHEQVAVGKALQTGDTRGLFWDARDPLGNLVPTGRYSWLLEGTDGQGRNVRAAAGRFIVSNGHLRGAVLSDANGSYHVGTDTLGAAVAQPMGALAVLTRSANRTAIATGPAERGRYGSGATLAPRIGALLRNNEKLYVVTADDTISPFASTAVSDALGYTLKKALPATSAHLRGIRTGAPISDTTRHPTGAFVRVPCAKGTTCTPQVFRMRSADRIEVTPLGVLGLGATKEVVDALAGDLALPVAVGTVDGPDGTLVRLPSGAHWYVESGTRRMIRDVGLFEASGERVTRAIPTEWSTIGHLPIGDPIR